MASGRAIDARLSAQLLSLSRRSAFPFLAFLVCHAGASEPPSWAEASSTETTTTTFAPSTLPESSAAAEEGAGGGGRGGTSSLEVVAIVCGVLVAVGVGTALLCCIHKRRRDKRHRMRDALSYGRRGWGERWGDNSKVGEVGGSGGGIASGTGTFPDWQQEGAEARPLSALSSRGGTSRGGTSRGGTSRAASIALMAAPFEGGRAWHNTEDGQGLDLELGNGGGGGGGDGGRGRGLRRMSSGSTLGPRFSNPLYEARMNRAVAIGRLTGAAATASPSAAGDDADAGDNNDDDEEEEAEGEEKAGFFAGGGGGRGGCGGGGGGGAIRTSHGKMATATTTPTTDASGSVVLGRRDHEGIVAEGGATTAAETATATLGRRSSAPEPMQAYHKPDQPSDDDDDDDDDDDGGSATSPRRRSTGNADDQAAAAAAAAARKGGVRIAPSPASVATSAVLKVAEGVVAGAQSLSPLERFVPGAREALGVVAGLARLAAADHRGDTKAMRQRVRWCQGVVLTLNKSRVLLGKATARDENPKRVALEAVREPVERMVEIVQTYKNKHVVSDVFLSGLFRRRHAEAQEAVLLAERHLSALAREDEEDEQETAEAVLANADRLRRRRQSVLLDQVDIPAASLDVMKEEVLGVGGFGTVYLADLGGLNAAAKVVLFNNKPARSNGGEHGDADDDDGDDGDDDGENSDSDDGGGGDVGRRQQTGEDGGRSYHAGADAYDSGNLPAIGGSRQRGGAGGGAEQRGAAEGQQLLLQEKATRGEAEGEVTLEPVDQKARRRAVVAQAKRAASEQRLLTRERLSLCKELEAMKRLRGPNTVHTYGAVTTLGRNRLVLVMEFLPGGDLLQRLRKAKRPLQERVLRRIVTDVCSGMSFLHRQAFVHGDLKSANVLFDADGTAKVGDLGTSLWTQCTNRVATYSARPGGLMSLPWAAPEVLRRDGATEKSDVYSFGVVLWECLARRAPWEGVSDVRTLFRAVRAGERPPIPDDAPPDLAALARACWAGDPAARPTLEAVLEGLVDGVTLRRATEGGGGQAPAAAAAAADDDDGTGGADAGAGVHAIVGDG
eukprot:g4130.t1